MKYFKVTDLQLRSLFFDCYHGKGVQYKLNEFAYPQVGKLFCYNLSHLSETGFMEYDMWVCTRDRRIFECECVSPIEKEVHIFRPYGLSPTRVGNTSYATDFDICRDVVLADGIKLTKELTSDDIRKLIIEKFGDCSF